MFKFFLPGLILWQSIYEISCQNDDAMRDTKMPSIATISLQGKKDNDETNLSGSAQNYYVHAANLIINLNSLPSRKYPMDFFSSSINPVQKIGSDYVETLGMGAHKLHARKLTWSKARKICNEEGGHLAIIRSDSEEKIILQMMQEDSIEDAWLGVHDRFEEGEWITVMDEPLGETGWAKWSKKFANNPDNYGNKQNCGRIVKTGGGMDDDNCDIAKPFVCKKTDV